MLVHKLLKIAIFFIYWLGFAPWLVLLLRKEEILSVASMQDIFLQGTTVFFILIIIYIAVHQVFDRFYLRHKIKKAVRKVTIKHQLERLERGEIDLIAAQRISTFLTIREAQTVKKMASFNSQPKEKKVEASKVNENKQQADEPAKCGTATKDGP